MDPIFTYQKLKNYLLLLLGIITLTVISNESYAQSKNYATVTPSRGTVTYQYPLLGLGGNKVIVSDDSVAVASVTNPQNASSATSTNPTILSASSATLLGLASIEGESWMQFKYSTALKGGKTTFIPFDTPVATGFNLDLLGTLVDLTTGLMNKQFIIAEAYSGAVSGTTGISGTKIADANVTTTIVRDGAGKSYFAITSTVDYNSVRIRLRNETKLLQLSFGNSITLNLYTPFNNDANICGTPLYTTVGEATGVNVSLTKSVLNPERAVDGNPATFSQLQPGLVGLGSTISQTFYLNGLSVATDVAKVSLSQPGSVLNLSLLNTIRLQAYNGSTPVGAEQSGSSLLGLDLLGLFSNNTVVPVYFTPGAAFDRIKVSTLSAVNVGGSVLAGGLNINEVERTIAKPLFGGTVNGTLAVCGGANIVVSVQKPDPDFTYNLYTANTDGTLTLVEGGNTTGAFTISGVAAGIYTAYVSARKVGCTAESDKDKVVVTVAPALVFGAFTLPNAMVSAPYSKIVNAATGGTPATGTGVAPYTYALATGSTLPAGLSIVNGAISGTPTAAGTFTFSLTATDGLGCKTTAVYTLTVAGKLVFATTTLPNGMVTKPYTPTTLPLPTGGTGPYTYTSANLPAGLTLNPATGQLTGTPTTAGAYTFTVTITDADQNMVAADFKVTVRDLLTLPAATLSDGTKGKPYPTQIIPAAVGGSGTFTYSATGLPAGLSFNTATREITGTPTVSGTSTVQVTVTDNEGNTATANYNLIVRDPLVLTAGALPDATVAIPYPVQTIPAAAGGVGPYTYLATNVPTGLLFDPVTRNITGIPLASGNFTISVKVTDAANNTITVPYTLRVIGTMVLPIAVLPSATVGTAYTSPALPAVIGGVTPYIYSVTGLPAGLNFDAGTRVISGTPTQGGVFTVTMTVKDANNSTTSTDYILNVNIGNPIVAGATICAGNAVTLAVASPVTGITYNFYSSTGNTVLGTGTTYNTGVLTQTTTFYAEAVSGTAISARIPVVVTVNPAPAAPAVSTNNITVTTGQTATLSATAAAGSTVNWFAAATGGVPLSTTGSFTTPALSATTTYYAGAVDNTTNCASLTRVPAVVNVIGANPTANCNAANTQQSGVSALLCVGCAINGPGNSTDADPTNFTQLAIPVGLGASAYQQLIFQRAGVATDSVRLDLETPTGLINLTALGGITVNILNGTTVVKSYPLNQSLINLQILSGNRFKGTFAATGVYDRVEVRFNPVVAALSNVNIYGAQVIYPNPTVVSGNQTICSGSTAALQITPAAGTSVVWYSDATGGTILSSQNTFTTPALTATTTYYLEVSKNGCANPTRVPVVVTVTPVLTVPVLAAVSPVCAGSPAVLSVNTPIAGITYKWYTAATGGTSVFTGPVYTTTALTANISYFVEASNGSCTSPSRAEAAVTVNPLPILPQVRASATTVTSGQTVLISATSTEPNVTFNWYTSANSTTPVFTGPDFITPPLTATTTYYVDATSAATGCASSSRVQTTITVSGPGTPLPTLCEFPVSQTNGVSSGVALLAGVINPELVLDNDQHTGSTLSIPVGLLGATISQKVNFTGLSNVGDTVQVRLAATSRLLSLSLLPNVTISTFNGATNNNDGLIINNPLLSVVLLNGGQEALYTFVPTAQFDGVQVSLNSGVVGALTAINFNSARRIVQAATVTVASAAVCVGSTTTLTVTNPKPGITYKWYDATGTYLGNDGTTFTTPVITANTQFFVDATRNGCSGSRTTVNVTAVPAPVTPVLLSSIVETCPNSDLVLQVQNPQTGATYNWYKDGSTTPVAGQNGASLTVTNITANAVYTVEAVNSCAVKSAQATVTVTVGSLAAPTVALSAVTINSGEAAILRASSSTAGVAYTWYTDPALSPVSIVSTAINGADGNYNTGLLTNTTTYYVTAQVPGGCVSTASTVLVTVNPVPNDGSIVPCEAATTETATTPLLTSVTNPGFAVDDKTGTGSSLFIAAGLLNTSVSQRVTFPNGTSQPGDQVKLGISSPAALLSLGVGQSISVTTYNGGVSNNDTQVISNPLLNLQILTGNKDATVQFTPAKPFDGVELKLTSGLVTALTSINFNYAQRIQVPPTVVAAAVTVCQGTTKTLAVLNPVTGVTYNWSDDNGTPIPPGDSYALPTTLAPGTYNYYVTATRTGCASAKTQVVVTVTGAAAAPVASVGNPTNTCLNTPAILKVDQASGVTYNWYDAATGGNVLASNTNSFTTPANLPVGPTIYYVEAVNANSCANAGGRTAIQIIVNPSATAADITVAGNEKPFCAGTTAQLTATSLTVTNPVFTWYTDAALTNAVFTGPVYNITNVTAATTYYVSVSGTNKCNNTSGTGFAVPLLVNPPSVPADITVATTSTGACAGAVYTFTATAAGVTNPVFTWYSDAALTQVVPNGNSAILTTVALTATTTYYVAVSGDNKCANVSGNGKAVTAVINPPADATDIVVNGVPNSICAGSGVTLTATSTTVQNPVFTWYSDAALTVPVSNLPVLNVPALTQTTTYYVTVSGLNKCENTGATANVVVLTVNPQLIFADATLADGTVASSYSVQIPSPTGGTPGYTYSVPVGGTLPDGLSLSAGGILSGTPVTANTYTFTLITTDSKGCNATANFTLNIASPLTLPPATLPDGQVGTIYVTQTLPAATGGKTPYVYTVTGLPNGLSIDPVTREITGTPTLGGSFPITVLVTDAANRTATGTYTINVTVPAPVVANAQTCPGIGVTLAVNNPLAGVTYKWYADANGGVALNQGTTYATGGLNATTTYYAEASSGTAVSTRTAVTVTVNPPANASDIQVAGVPSAVCSGSGVSLTATSTTVTNPVFTWYSDAALTQVVSNTAVLSVPALTQTTSYYVTVKGDNSCANSVATAKEVVLTVNPVLVFNGTPLPAGAVATAYSTQLNAATGGTAPYTYSVTAGNALPDGLSLSADGLITGTPTTLNTYNFSLTATDSKGCSAAANFSIVIGNTPPVLNLPLANLPDGQVGTVYVTQTLPAANGGTAPYTYVATGVPNGLSFDPVTREITGTPTLGGSFPVSVTVTDAANNTITVNYTINVTVPAPVVAAAQTCPGIGVTLAVNNPLTGVTYNWYAAANGGVALSQGTTYATGGLNATTTYYAEASSGTALSARTPVTVTVNPPANASDIQVAGVPSAVCSGSGASLTASSTTITNPVFTWYSDAALTQVVSNTATLSVPALTQTTTYYVTVKGDNSCANSAATAKAVVLTVNPVLVFNGTPLPAGAVATAYNVQLNAATGGTAPYTYSVTAGNALPDGLSLSPAGLITGTPTTLNNYNFSLTATDSKGCSASANFSIAIGNVPPVLNLPLANLPDGQVGTVYVTQTLPAATGGTIPYIYTAAGLPDGLRFDPSTRQISGTPTTGGSYPVSVTVTDAANNTITVNYTINVTVPAPVVASAQTCPGISVNLTVNNPLTGVIYKWYANANGGVALNQGTTYATGGLNATTTYYAEASSGTAVSTRTAVTVTVNPPANASDIQIAGVPSAVCSGSGASLTAASGTITNPVFTWYSDAALTQIVSGTAAFNTPVLTQTTTYYVTVKGDNSCANSVATAKAVVLTVNPALVFNGTTLPAGPAASAYSAQLNAATGGTAPYTYSVTAGNGNALPAGLALSPAGLITGTPAVPGSYTFSVTVTDGKGCSAAASFSLIVGNAAQVLSIPPANLPDGQIGTGYPVQVIPAANGGTAPYTYVATGLPNGLSFDPITREITGTPTLGGTFQVTVTVTDAANNTATGTYSINVTVPAPVVANAKGCAGSGATLTVSNPLTGVTYKWYANASGGAALNQGTTYLTDPLTAATTTYYAEASSGTAVSTRTAVTVTLNQAATASDIQVAGVPAAVCSGSGASLTASSATITQNPVFTWYSDAALTQVVSNTASFLTPVLTQNTTYYVTVKGDNTCENSAATAKAVVLSVNPVLVFTGRTLPVAALASTYNVQLSPATGGTPGYTYSVTPGNSLPAGLSLSPAGLLSGTPAVLGSYTFSLTATDSKGCTAAADFSLTVNNGTTGTITLPTATLPNGQVGTSYPVQVLPAATGGTAPYTYVATKVPAGLSFNTATREITGTPGLGGTFVITVAVTDANGATGVQDYTITVTVPAPVVAAAQACAGSGALLAVTSPVTGVTYNWYAAANGGAVLHQGTTFQTPAITTTTTYYVEGVSGTAISGRVAASVTVSSALSAPVVTVQASTVISVTFSWNNISGASGYEVSTDGGNTWVTPTSGFAGNTHTVLGLQTNASVTLLVRAVGSTVCQTSASGSATGTASSGSSNDVFIPNTFTPNGDGKNDIFYVYGSSITKVRLRIYNQWGQFIYESLQLQSGWDGTYKGQLQPNGVYVYYAELTFSDGTTALKKGSVTLLR